MIHTVLGVNISACVHGGVLCLLQIAADCSSLLPEQAVQLGADPVSRDMGQMQSASRVLTLCVHIVRG